MDQNKDISDKLDKFRAGLAEESDHPLSDSVFEYILANSTLLSCRKGEAIIDFGTVDSDLYFMVDGITRGFVRHNATETNVYFGLEGTMLNSMQCYSYGEPSILRIEACCPTILLRVTKENYDRMMRESHEFCLWMSGVFSRRSTFAELKAKMMDGDARWRYEWLEKCRPELFDHVPLKAIASYLNMSEVHVSRIRKQIAGN